MLFNKLYLHHLCLKQNEKVSSLKCLLERFNFNKMGHKLLLNIYHLNPNNQFLYKIGLGFYHTEIEVNGMAYSFGGNPYASGTGVFMQSA